jgi:hypothetical protein
MLNADKVSQKECFNPYYAPRTRRPEIFAACRLKLREFVYVTLLC